MEPKKTKSLQIAAISLTAAAIAVVVGLVFIFTANNETLPAHNSSEDTVGSMTVYQTLYGDDSETAASNAKNSMNELFRLLSYGENGSDIQTLNQSAGLGPVTLDSRTITILDTAKKVAEASNGAFCPTIVPIYNLWGFSGTQPTVPAQAQIEQFLPYIDYRSLQINTQENTASLSERSAVSLDGMLNGALCQSAVSSYRTSGVSAGIITAGNSVGVYGTKPDGSQWNLAIKNPDTADTETPAIGSFTIASGYASTCQLEQVSFTQNGTTYYGVLDPATGKPVQTDLVSVTVTHADGPTSDALALACMVLGREKGMALLEQYQADGIFIDRENNVTVTGFLKDSVQLAADSYTLATA